jgi:Ca2+-binding RTX toxin-like protein
VASNGQVIAAGSGPSYTFTPDNNGTYMVTYSVTDDDGDSSSDTITINVNNVAPTVSFTGPASGVRGQTLQFVGSFSDPGADAWTATVDFGDGSSDQPIVLNPDKSFGFGHAYTSSGSYTVTVTVQDGEPGGIGSFSRSLTVSALAVLADSCCAQALFVGGSTGADNLLIRPGNLGSLVISINSVESTIDPIATPFGRIVIFAQAGNDDIQVAGSISIPITARGGAGDDRLKGGDGNDILLGEEGDDLVVGGQGRDLLIGGVGADRIVGNADDDILIAGRTSFDSIDSSLCAIMAEWTSAAGYNTRVAHLRGDISSGLNGSILLNDQTVHDDAVEDILTGSSGQDWFLFNQDGDGGRRDRITDLSASEFANDIDFINGA